MIYFGRLRDLYIAKNILEPDPKVVEQYQHVMIHAVLARNGVINGMDWHCSR